jgi:chitosanase
MVATTQKDTAEAIVNIFETGSVLGDYSKVTVLDGDPGHLTFGRSQTTLSSGNLYVLVNQYCEQPGALFAARLQPFLSQLQAGDTTLDENFKLQNTLRASADDPVMRDTQDAFFETNFWDVSAADADATGIATPLGVAVVYDSHVHGSWPLIRDKTIQAVGTVANAGEEKWISKYVQVRRAWLAASPKTRLRATVYRMDAFRRLIDQGYWTLTLPLVVRGIEISAASLAAVPFGCYEGPQPGSRALSIQSPLPRGLDVRLVQLGLSDRNFDLLADGIFGQTTSTCVRQYQQANSLPVTGIAQPDLIVQLIT